jgi:hypothetical protein
MRRNDWLRGVKRSPEDFDRLVLMIAASRPERNWTAKHLSERLAQFNGNLAPDVNRVLRSMKRLAAKDAVVLGHYSRGWFNYYWIRVARNG